jgi:uncharacterized protein (DUF58 family)
MPGLAAADTEARSVAPVRLGAAGRPLGLDYGLRLPGVEIKPASGEAHKRRCLEALALC